MTLPRLVPDKRGNIHLIAFNRSFARKSDNNVAAAAAAEHSNSSIDRLVGRHNDVDDDGAYRVAILITFKS